MLICKVVPNPLISNLIYNTPGFLNSGLLCDFVLEAEADRGSEQPY